MKEDKKSLKASDDRAMDMKCELKTWHSVCNKDGTQETIPAESLKQSGPKNDEERHVVEVTRIFDEKNHLESTKLVLNSPYIVQALQAVVKDPAAAAADLSEPFELTSPFQTLFHFWDDIAVYRKGLQDDYARMHLAVLMDFMHSELSSERRQVDVLINSGHIDFARLWVIYPPGTVVVRYTKDLPWLLRVVKTAFETHAVDGQYFEVHCVYTDYDGKNFGESELKFTMYQSQYFAQQNPAKINELPVYPRNQIQNDDDLEDRLHARGCLFLSFTEACIRRYEGTAEYLKQKPFDYYHPQEDDDDLVWLSYHEAGRVIVDRITFQADHPRRSVKKLPVGALNKSLCPPFVIGYSTNRKEWCRLFLENIRECVWEQNAFDRLILPDDRKSYLRALLSGHVCSGNPYDPIQQKGKGLVILLHGPPGSGKTLTAECSAELTRSALFNTSMSELNTNDSVFYFQRRLAKVLQLATTWNAIVLLDEADIFLEARDSTSSTRNAIVAAFLRHLEYFSGIVFLTTNRIQSFDSAMRSRIHVALYYGPPGPDSRRQIWKQNLIHRLEESQDIDLDVILDELAVIPIDGREITNAINTACTWARFDSVPVSMKQIRGVLKIRNDFLENLKEAKAIVS